MLIRPFPHDRINNEISLPVMDVLTSMQAGPITIALPNGQKYNPAHAPPPQPPPLSTPRTRRTRRPEVYRVQRIASQNRFE